jgi:hypothetical protein
MSPTTPSRPSFTFTDPQNSFLNERFQAFSRDEIVFRALTHSPNMTELFRRQNMSNVLNQLQNGNYVHFDRSFYFGKYNDMLFIFTFTLNGDSIQTLYLMSFQDELPDDMDGEE